MSETVTEPLLTAFDVACSAEHAVDVWTTRISTWWPNDHTNGGGDVVLEQGVGGRLLERQGDGTEHVWGEITTWDPPARLGYTWHIGQPVSNATDVEVRFVAVGDDATRVEIEQRGWETYGSEAGIWRARNRIGWDSLATHFTRAIEES